MAPKRLKNLYFVKWPCYQKLYLDFLAIFGISQAISAARKQSKGILKLSMAQVVGISP